jgi:hypothetical protein
MPEFWSIYGRFNFSTAREKRSLWTKEGFTLFYASRCQTVVISLPDFRDGVFSIFYERSS